jgi:hypothetical protein
VSAPPIVSPCDTRPSGEPNLTREMHNSMMLLDRGLHPKASYCAIRTSLSPDLAWLACLRSGIDMYNNDGGKKFMKQTGALKAATLYFAS